jgi:hypothetical protein
VRDPKRISQILGGLGAIWQANPDWRFGQLIENVMQVEDLSAGYDEDLHRCIFYIEDDDTLGILRDALRTDGNT